MATSVFQPVAGQRHRYHSGNPKSADSNYLDTVESEITMTPAGALLWQSPGIQRADKGDFGSERISDGRSLSSWLGLGIIPASSIVLEVMELMLG